MRSYVDLIVKNRFGIANFFLAAQGHDLSDIVIAKDDHTRVRNAIPVGRAHVQQGRPVTIHMRLITVRWLLIDGNRNFRAFRTIE